MEEGDDAMFRHARFDLETQLGEALRDIGGRLFLLVREFGIRVEMAAGLDEFGEELFDRLGENRVALRPRDGMGQGEQEKKCRGGRGDGEENSLHLREHRKPRHRRQAAIGDFD